MSLELLEQVPPKRRGRKVVKEPGEEVVPKRGRKPKTVIAYEANVSEQKEATESTTSVVLKLKVQNPNSLVTAEGHCTTIDESVADVGAYNEGTLSNYSTIAVSQPIEPDICEAIKPSNVTKVGTNKVVKLLQEFEEKARMGEWPLSTSIACYWCCHRFDTPPIGLPCKFVDSKFHIKGCFCSLECASAYNISNTSDGQCEERLNLLSFMARSMNYKSPIKPAPPRESLDLFGGNMTIEQFRSHSTSSKSIHYNFPPMRVLVHYMEEVNDSDVYTGTKYVPLDHGRIDRYKEKMKLARVTPLGSLENVFASPS